MTPHQHTFRAEADLLGKVTQVITAFLVAMFALSLVARAAMWVLS